MVRVDKSGPIWTVVIDRPETRNAIDRATADGLASAFRGFEQDPSARVAVLWGAGGAFSAGADLKALERGDGNSVAADGDAPLGCTRLRLSKPVIAAISGHAVAGGFELALWCDLRVVEENAVFGVFCRRFGVPLIDGGTVRLPRLIGESRALDLILTGRPVPASEALQMGLANRVVPQGEARERAEELAREIAAFPSACLTHDRASVLEQHALPFDHAMANEFRHGQESLNAPELKDALDRFVRGAGRHGRFD